MMTDNPAPQLTDPLADLRERIEGHVREAGQAYANKRRDSTYGEWSRILTEISSTCVEAIISEPGSVRELVEALKPFANFADPKVEDFDRARTALSHTEGQKP